MENYEPAMSFGEDTARIYDRVARRGDEEATVAFLAELAGDGPALELAIGTGRIALPLAARGVEIEGIEISPAMVDRLRAKPGGDQIPVTLGDFADVPVDGTVAIPVADAWLFGRRTKNSSRPSRATVGLTSDLLEQHGHAHPALATTSRRCWPLRSPHARRRRPEAPPPSERRPPHPLGPEQRRARQEAHSRVITG